MKTMMKQATMQKLLLFSGSRSIKESMLYAVKILEAEEVEEDEDKLYVHRKCKKGSEELAA